MGKKHKGQSIFSSILLKKLNQQKICARKIIFVFRSRYKGFTKHEKFILLKIKKSHRGEKTDLGWGGGETD